MKSLLQITIFTILMIHACAVIDYCVYKGMRIKVNDLVPHPTECKGVRCFNDNSITFVMCPDLSQIRPSCKHIGENKFKKYPQCCPTLDCLR